MTFVAMNATFGLLLHEFFELGKQAAVRFFVVRRVLQNDFPVAVNGDAIDLLRIVGARRVRTLNGCRAKYIPFVLILALHKRRLVG